MIALELGTVAYVCNPSYFGGRLRPAWDPISKKGEGCSSVIKYPQVQSPVPPPQKGCFNLREIYILSNWWLISLSAMIKHSWLTSNCIFLKGSLKIKSLKRVIYSSHDIKHPDPHSNSFLVLVENWRKVKISWFIHMKVFCSKVFAGEKWEWCSCNIKWRKHRAQTVQYPLKKNKTIKYRL